MILYYIRHGEPIYKPNQLTPFGKRQAEAVGKRLSIHGIDRIFSSPSNRALETAIPLSELTGKEIELLDFADEAHAARDFMAKDENGSLKWVSGIKDIRIHFADPAIKTRFDWYDHPAFEGYNFKEGIERVNTEADKLLESLGYKHIRGKGYYEPIDPNEQRIALFAHAGFGQVFMSSLLDIPYPQISTRFDMCHTGITLIQFRTYTNPEYCIPRVLSLSDSAHLMEKDIPSDYVRY